MRYHQNKTGQEWLDRVFACRAVENSRAVKRQAIDVERKISRDAFVLAVKARGFCLIPAQNYFVVLCGRYPAEIL